MNDEMKNMAMRLGLQFPADASEHEQLAAIANQVGMPDYYYNTSDNAKLYNTLKDMCGEYGIPSNIATEPYDPDVEPDYMSDKYQNSRKDKDEDKDDKEDEDEEKEDEDGKEDDSKDGKSDEEGSSDGNDSSDSDVDSNNPNTDPNNPNADPNNPNADPNNPNQQNPNEPGHPGEEGPGYNPDSNGENGSAAPNQGVALPNQNHDQRDTPTSPGEGPGYGDVGDNHGNDGEGGVDRSNNGVDSSQPQPSQNQNQGGTPHKNLDEDRGKDGNSGASSGNKGQTAQYGNQNTNAGGNKNKQQQGGSEGATGTAAGPAPAGNGYGALRNKNNGGGAGNRGAGNAPKNGDGSDATSNARRNLEHNNRMKGGSGAGGGASQGEGAEHNNKTGERSDRSKAGKGFSGLGSRIKNGISRGLGLGRKEDRSVGDNSGGSSDKEDRGLSKIKDLLKKKIRAFFKAHPFALIVLIILCFFIFVVFFFVVGSGSGNGVGGAHVNIDYGDYSLSSDGKQILHEPLDSFLQKNGSSLEALNQLIESNVEKAGYGTREGVVAAAVTLIGELGDQYNVLVPYYWGGGHYDGVVVGALGKWGSTQCHTYANGQSYNYCGFDCSGFVPWAIKNGGFNRGTGLAGGFVNSSGAKKVTLNSNKAVIQPGDLLESSHHIILVVGIDEESKEYICAEAMGNAYGTRFSRRSFGLSGYWGVSLEDYYNNPSNVRSK